MRYIFFILILLGSLLKAQTDDLSVRDSVVVDNGQKDSIQIFRPTIDDYQFFTQFSQRKAFDTVFTIGKSYQFTQYNNRDNFGIIAYKKIFFYTGNQGHKILRCEKSYYGILLS